MPKPGAKEPTQPCGRWPARQTACCCRCSSGRHCLWIRISQILCAKARCSVGPWCRILSSVFSASGADLLDGLPCSGVGVPINLEDQRVHNPADELWWDCEESNIKLIGGCFVACVFCPMGAPAPLLRSQDSGRMLTRRSSSISRRRTLTCTACHSLWNCGNLTMKGFSCSHGSQSHRRDLTDHRKRGRLIISHGELCGGPSALAGHVFL